MSEMKEATLVERMRARGLDAPTSSSSSKLSKKKSLVKAQQAKVLRKVLTLFRETSTTFSSARDLRDAARMIGIRKDWVNCNFKIPGNRKDLEKMVLREIKSSSRFLKNGLDEDEPRETFRDGTATSPLTCSSRNKFWMARGTVRRHKLLKSVDLRSTFDATVHFVQSTGGTGVHVGNGLVLTCAHVVSTEDDEDDDVPNRCGRIKFIMFPSKLIYACVCLRVLESGEGRRDVALLRIVCEADETIEKLPFARLRDEDVALKCDDTESLFCVGNPSDINLEASRPDERNEFDPPVWHASVGTYKGITRKKGLGEIMHTCWTYWGHSGAPLFDHRGLIVGLHSSWDSSNGMRHGVSISQLHEILRG